MRFSKSFGNIYTEDHTQSAEIVVRTSKECLGDIALGMIGVAISMGIVYLRGYFRGAKAFDRAEYKAQDSLGLIENYENGTIKTFDVTGDVEC